MTTSSIRSVVALATSLLLFGCLGRSDEELDQPADLLPGQMALQEYPATSSGIISSDLQGSLDLPLLGAEAIEQGELTSGDPSWSRPTNQCASLEDRPYPYDGYLLSNQAGSATFQILVEAMSSGAGSLNDPMVFLYRGASLPADLTWCLASDDDGHNGRDSRIQVNLAGGSQSLLVVTSYTSAPSEAAYGSYRIRIDNLGW